MAGVEIRGLPDGADEDTVRIVLERAGCPDFDGDITIDQTGDSVVATVYFASQEEAADAVGTIHGMILDGDKLEASLEEDEDGEDEEEIDEARRRTFAIGNLPDSHCDKAKLDAFGRRFGQLEWICVEREERFGFLQYQHGADAEHAFRVMDNQVIEGRALFCVWIPPRVLDRSDRRRPAPSRGITMSNLPASVQTDMQLEALAGEFGMVESTEFWPAKHVGAVVFATRDEAEKAFRALNGKTIEGRLIQCNWSKNSKITKAVTPESRNIRVNNLPASLRIESAFERVCERFGPVESVIVLRTGPVGFCQFATHEAAQKAMSGLNGLQVDGSTLRVAWGENKGAKAEQAEKNKTKRAKR